MPKTSEGLLRTTEFMRSRPKLVQHISIHPAMTQQAPAQFVEATNPSHGVVRHGGPAINFPQTQQQPASFMEGEGGVQVVHHYAPPHPPENFFFGPEQGAAFHQHMARFSGIGGRQ